MVTDREESLDLEIQYVAASGELPAEADFRRWVLAALEGIDGPVELVIRLVDEEESRELNHRYRGRDKPTNVLSFTFEVPPGVEAAHLGDLVICAPVVIKEAQEQHKHAGAHWAHMVVHGVLHLRGYDHQDEAAAEAMEQLEREILSGLGIGDPYRLGETG